MKAAAGKNFLNFVNINVNNLEFLPFLLNVPILYPWKQ